MPYRPLPAAYIDLLDDLPLLAGLLSPEDGRILALNKIWADTTPIDYPPSIGQRLVDTYWLGHDPRSQEVVSQLVHKATGGERAINTTHIRLSDNLVERVKLTIKPIGDVAGDGAVLLFFIENMTVQNGLHVTHDEQSHLFQMATSAAETGVWSLDLKTQGLVWSDVHKVMWGYPSDAQDLRYEDWHNPILEEDREQAFEQVRKARDEKSTYIAEYRIKRVNDGQVRWMRSKGIYRYNHQGEPTKLLGISYDITLEKASEQKLHEMENRFRETLLSIPDGYMIFESVRDQQGEIVDFKWLYVNVEAERIVNRKAEDLLGKYLLVEMPGNKDAGVFDAYKQVVKTGARWENQFDYPYDGMNLVFHSKAVKIDDGFAVVFSDITLKKQFERELEQRVAERTAALQTLNKKLMQSNAELENYAFVTSHDLQEPLRKIEMFASILDTRSENLDEKDKNYVERIGQAASRMRLLIDSLLQFSKTNYQEEDRRLVDLNEKIRLASSMLEVKILEKEATIEIEQVLPQVLGVPNLILIVMLNIISNSLKFVQAGVKPHIKVNWRKASPDEILQHNLDAGVEYTILCIQDNGIGFDRKHRRHIFSMFKRLHHTDEYEGTGMGLALCVRIMGHHRGIIVADSILGEGTRMDVYFPTLK